MSRFRPSRVSSPAKPASLPDSLVQASISDISRSSAVSLPEFRGLTPEDVGFIDAVIDRAAPSATNFLTVFKAYNDILHERGLDPQNEVVYYRKLLKIGSLRGENWGEKWNYVKVHHGYEEGRQAQSRTPPAKPVPSTRFNGLRVAPLSDDDVFTLHSHQDDEDTLQSEGDVETELESGDNVPQYHGTPSRLLQGPVVPNSKSRVIKSGLAPTLPSRSQNASHTPARHTTAWDDSSDDTDNIVPSLSTIPPSYGSAIRDSGAHRRAAAPIPQSSLDSPASFPALRKPMSLQPDLEKQMCRGGIADEDETWNNIKNARDEKIADRFWEDRLVERCWDVWRQGYQWIITTNEQISEARDKLLLRQSLQHWRFATASRIETYERVAKLSDHQRMHAALNAWKAKLKSKRQMEWRNDMRARMKLVREKREMKLRKDAWAKWRQSHRSHLSGQRYNERLCLKFFQRWKHHFAEVDHLEAAADEFANNRDRYTMQRCLSLWRRTLEMKISEKTIAERVGLRVMTEAMAVWRQRTRVTHSADIFYDVLVLQRAVRSWKAAKDRIQNLESRASKHVVRQDEILVRAVMRVWKARERGRLLDRVKMMRLLKGAWAVWRGRLAQQKQLEETASAFSIRGDSYVSAAGLQRWRKVYYTHRNALAFAVQYHSAQLVFKTLVTWRIHLRSKMKLLKQAKVAEKFFVERRTLNIWLAKLDERKREKKLKVLEAQRLKTVFHTWMHKARSLKTQRLAELEMKKRIDMRIATTALNRWTNHVIQIKLLELDVANRHALALMTSAFRTWKYLCERHVDELSLMQSYQDVRREESMKRIFHKWLKTAREARHRRESLQKREEEFKWGHIAVAWDKWRERFKDEKLRLIERNVILQNQRSQLYHAFAIWHSRTRTLPAIHFNARHTKAKFWHIWRAAMPQALQARKAREIDKRTVLSKALGKWVQNYKTKIALKAVARARYLRLPVATPRHITPAVKPSPASVPTRSSFPRRNIREETDTGESDAGPSRPTSYIRPIGNSHGIASLLTARPRPVNGRSPRSRTSAHSTRDPSPAPSKSSLATNDPQPHSKGSALGKDRAASPTPSRSSLGANRPRSLTKTILPAAPTSASTADMPGRTSLWQELQEVRAKARSRGSVSPSRKPP